MGRLTVPRDLRHDRESNSTTRILDMTLKVTYLKIERMLKDAVLLLTNGVVLSRFLGKL